MSVTRIKTDVEVLADVTIDGNVTVRDQALAQYLRLSYMNGQFRPAAGAAGATQELVSGYPGWRFGPTVDQSIIMAWAPPKISDIPTPVAAAFWATLTPAIVWVNEGVGAGNVRWQIDFYNYRLGIDNVFTMPPTQTNLATVSAGGQGIQNASVIGSAFPLNPGPFSSEYKVVITRLAGSDTVNDTLAENALVGLVSWNRPTP